MTRGRYNRAALTREAVLRAALAIGDAEGAGAVGIRSVAGALGVTPMALYRYVENKEALLDGCAGVVLAEVELPDPAAADWWDGLRAIAVSTRAALRRHPSVAAHLLSSGVGFGEAGLRIAETMLALLRKAGLRPADAAAAYAQIARFVLALVALELGSLPERSAEERRRRAARTRAELEGLPRADFPNLVAAASHLARPYDPERLFEQGLELLRAGVESQLR